MIDVETAEVLAFGLADAPGAVLLEGVIYAVDVMLRTAQPSKAVDMPKMAVYVAGDKAGQREGSALYSYTLEALFTRSRNLGTFKVVERSDAFTRQIDREQATQRGGHVSNDQITQLGKQYGIGRILVASIESAMNTYNVSARIINIETARVERASDIRSIEANDLKSLRKISTAMVEEMMGLTAEETNERAARKAEADRKLEESKEVMRKEREKVEKQGTYMGYLFLLAIPIGLIYLAVAGPKKK